MRPRCIGARPWNALRRAIGPYGRRESRDYHNGRRRSAPSLRALPTPGAHTGGRVRFHQGAHGIAHGIRTGSRIEPGGVSLRATWPDRGHGRQTGVRERGAPGSWPTLGNAPPSLMMPAVGPLWSIGGAGDGAGVAGRSGKRLHSAHARLGGAGRHGFNQSRLAQALPRPHVRTFLAPQCFQGPRSMCCSQKRKPAAGGSRALPCVAPGQVANPLRITAGGTPYWAGVAPKVAPPASGGFSASRSAWIQARLELPPSFGHVALAPPAAAGGRPKRDTAPRRSNVACQSNKMISGGVSFFISHSLAQAGFNERKQIPEIGHNNIGLVWVLGRCGKNLR
jgi:hypothetical protein